LKLISAESRFELAKQVAMISLSTWGGRENKNKKKKKKKTKKKTNSWTLNCER